MKEFLKKLKSRKFIAALIGIVIGLATVFGVDEGIASTVAGAVVTLASVITYIVVEGKIDAEGVKNAIIAIDGVVDLLDGEEEAVEE